MQTTVIRETSATERHQWTFCMLGDELKLHAYYFQQFIDGKQTIDLIDHDKKGRALEGVLALQIHVGGPMLVQFKDLVLKRLPEGGIIDP